MDVFGLGLAMLAALALLSEPSEWLTLTGDLTLTRCQSISPRYTHNSGSCGYWADGRLSAMNPDYDLRIDTEQSARRK
jgi:hypothetical protein